MSLFDTIREQIRNLEIDELNKEKCLRVIDKAETWHAKRMLRLCYFGFIGIVVFVDAGLFFDLLKEVGHIEAIVINLIGLLATLGIIKKTKL